MEDPLQRFMSLVGDCVSSARCLSTTSLAVLCAAAFLYFIVFVFYQLYLHPLAKYPGPLLGRITSLYDVYHAYKGDKHLLFYHLHQRYGSIVRFTPNTISINDPTALKAIYGHNANVQKSEFYKCFRAAPDAVSTLLATEKVHHARKRRVMGHMFSDHTLKGFEQYVLAHVENLVNKLGANVPKCSEGEKTSMAWSKAMDMQNWSNWLVFDIMGDLVFGKSLGTLGEHPDNRVAINYLMRAARRNYTVAAMPNLIYTGLEKWLPLLRGLYNDRNRYFAFAKQQVMGKMQRDKENPDNEGRKDIFSFLLHAKDPETGEGMPMPELWMEGNTLIVAGSDTSSTTLAATLYYLLKNPNYLTRLEQEIRQTFSRAEDIHMGHQLQSCVWLRACIDESLRMTPAVPGLLPREVLKGGLTIPSMELNLPAGVNVGIPIYAIHHHPDYVANPFTYDPTRWLPEQNVQNKDALHAVFNPFSLGIRACLGKPLVYTELSVAIARLVFEFDMRLAGDQHQCDFIDKEVKQGKRHVDEYQIQDWFLSNNWGPYAELRRRDFEEKADSAFGD